MILFTGKGALYNAFSNKYDCRAISLNNISEEGLIEEIKLAKVIVHNAALIYPQNYIEAVNSNFLSTKRIIDNVYKHCHDVKFINISSMSILQNTHVYRECADMDNYSFSKYISEIYCLNHPLSNIISLRFSTIFYQNPLKDGLSKLIYNAVKKGEINIINDGLAKRDFIPIEIVADYIYKICIDDNIKKDIFTIASGITFSFSDIANILIKRLPELKINNELSSETKEVLYHFDLNGLKKIGIISFLLIDYIESYIIRLKNDLANL